MAINPHRRLAAETVSLTLEVRSKNLAGQEIIAPHMLELTLAFDGRGVLREVAFVGRAKIGHGLDPLLHDLGIKLSRAIQGRDPDTGLAAEGRQ